MRVRASAWLFLTSIAVAGAAAGCGEEGVTPDNCPPLPLYDVRDENARNDPEIQAAYQAAVEAGCATPLGTAMSGTRPPPPSDGGAGGTPAQAGGAGG